MWERCCGNDAGKWMANVGTMLKIAKNENAPRPCEAIDSRFNKKKLEPKAKAC